MGLPSIVSRTRPVLSGVAVVAIAFALSLGGAPGNALAATGPEGTPGIVGVVQDSAGQPLPNAQVIVLALNRGTITDEKGQFTLRGLPPGAYHLQSMRIGYAPAHADVTLPASGADVRVTITMRVTPLTLGAVQVTATPTATDPRNLSQSTVEISGQALSRNLSTTVAQTLSSQPGVSVRFDGPAATEPVIRGLTGERVLVLQDGDRTGDLSSASQDHSVSIDPMTAERIEVVRGPASLLYGNSALGGVVNVITNDIPTSIPSRVQGYFNGQGESVTPGGAASAGVTVPLSQSVALLARAGGRRVDDLREGGGLVLDNSYFHNYYGVGGLGFSSGSTTGGVVYRGYRFDYGLPSADNEGSHIEGQRDEAVGRVEFTPPTGLFTSVRLNGTAQWYSHDEIESTGEVGTSFDLKTQTVDALARTRLGRVSGAVGASGLFKEYAATGEEALTPAANSFGTGAFIYQEIPLGGNGDPDDRVVRLQFGGRYDLYRIDSKEGDPKFGPARSLDFNNFSGSVGVNVPLGSVLNLGVSAARAFRAPTVEELFSNANHEAAGTYDKGNPNLKSEINQGLDATLRARSAKLTAEIGGYYSRINNFITPNIVGDTTLDDGETVPLNQFSQGDATLKGIEGRVEHEVARHFVLGAMGDLTRGSLTNGEPLPFMPAARLGALARWDNGRFNLGAEELHAFAQNRVPPAVTEDDPSAVSTDAYDLVNLSAGYTFTSMGRVNSITLRVDNLLDEQYRDAASRIKNFAFNPGRNVSLVYRVQF